MVPQMTCFQSIDHKPLVQYHSETHNILELKGNSELNFGHTSYVPRLVLLKLEDI